MTVLGKPLTRLPVVLVQNCGYIPSLLVNAENYIDQHLDTPELFQIQGNVSKVNGILNQLCSPKGFSKKVTVTDATVHDVIEAVKTFLTRLPEPLLCDRVCDELIEASQMDISLGSIVTSLRSSQPGHTAILHFLMTLFNKISRHSPNNSMDPRKLATVFVLDILKPLKLEDTDHVPLTFPTDRMQRLPYLIMVMEHFICNLHMFSPSTDTSKVSCHSIMSSNVPNAKQTDKGPYNPPSPTSPLRRMESPGLNRFPSPIPRISPPESPHHSPTPSVTKWCTRDIDDEQDRKTDNNNICGHNRCSNSRNSSQNSCAQLSGPMDHVILDLLVKTGRNIAVDHNICNNTHRAPTDGPGPMMPTAGKATKIQNSASVRNSSSRNAFIKMGEKRTACKDDSRENSFLTKGCVKCPSGKKTPQGSVKAGKKPTSPMLKKCQNARKKKSGHNQSFRNSTSPRFSSGIKSQPCKVNSKTKNTQKRNAASLAKSNLNTKRPASVNKKKTTCTMKRSPATVGGGKSNKGSRSSSRPNSQGGDHLYAAFLPGEEMTPWNPTHELSRSNDSLLGDIKLLDQTIRYPRVLAVADDCSSKSCCSGKSGGSDDRKKSAASSPTLSQSQAASRQLKKKSAVSDSSRTSPLQSSKETRQAARRALPRGHHQHVSERERSPGAARLAYLRTTADDECDRQVVQQLENTNTSPMSMYSSACSENEMCSTDKQIKHGSCDQIRQFPHTPIPSNSTFTNDGKGIVSQHHRAKRLPGELITKDVFLSETAIARCERTAGSPMAEGNPDFDIKVGDYQSEKLPIICAQNSRDNSPEVHHTNKREKSSTRNCKRVDGRSLSSPRLNKSAANRQKLMKEKQKMLLEIASTASRFRAQKGRNEKNGIKSSVVMQHNQSPSSTQPKQPKTKQVPITQDRPEDSQHNTASIPLPSHDSLDASHNHLEDDNEDSSTNLDLLSNPFDVSDCTDDMDIEKRILLHVSNLDRHQGGDQASDPTNYHSMSHYVGQSASGCPVDPVLRHRTTGRRLTAGGSSGDHTTSSAERISQFVSKRDELMRIYPDLGRRIKEGRHLVSNDGRHLVSRDVHLQQQPSTSDAMFLVLGVLAACGAFYLLENWEDLVLPHMIMTVPDGLID